MGRSSGAFQDFRAVREPKPSMKKDIRSPSGASYLILGAGKQGLAAAYDAALFGQARRVVLADGHFSAAKQGVARLKKLIGPALKNQKVSLSAVRIDARKKSSLKNAMRGHQAVLSALPYYLNETAAQAAIESGVHYCDLGGYFDSTRRIMKLDAKARKAGVTLITDCGVSPGMCNSLAVCGIEHLSVTTDVSIYCGGLPQNPRPPLGYKIVFNLEGVIGNYFGKAYVLKDCKVALVPSFSGREELDFGAELGTLEAVVTGGATSTCPWTFEGHIQNYTYKTLRYPGHYDKVQALKDLGLFETEPVLVNGQWVRPRDLFVAVAGPRLNFPDDRDLLVLKVSVRGQRDGRRAEAVYDVVDYFDPATGFTAMQRTTGFSAAVVLEMLALGQIHKRGFVPLEKAVPGRAFFSEIRRRGIKVKETIRDLH
jgi:lysine 6-dehydrogenase